MQLFDKNIDISFNETFNWPLHEIIVNIKFLLIIKSKIMLNRLPFILAKMQPVIIVENRKDEQIFNLVSKYWVSLLINRFYSYIRFI